MTQYLLLAMSSFGLGMLHALEPGHGKTVVGAYLVGSKGTTWDAILLGVVVTMTHTGIVIILGVLSVVAAAYFVPDTVQKVLEVVSGLLIVGVGGWMIGVRVRQARRPGLGYHDGHDLEHAHEAAREHEHALAHAHVDGHAHEEDDAHEHVSVHAHDHAHASSSHDHDEHDHGGHDHHAHGHPHGHSHAPVLKPGQKATWGQLVALGISGGIVPCPAALAVLLAAVGFGGFVRGVSLVVIFSLGMAATLVAIGIMIVHAARFAGRYVAESRWTRIVPVVSAILITLIGLGLTIKALAEVF